jgi:hypothetical protein
MLRYLYKSFILIAFISFSSFFNLSFAAIPNSNDLGMRIADSSLTNNLYAVGTNANAGQWNPVFSTWTELGYMGNWALKMIAFDKNNGTP